MLDDSPTFPDTSKSLSFLGIQVCCELHRTSSSLLLSYSDAYLDAPKLIMGNIQCLYIQRNSGSMQTVTHYNRHLGQSLFFIFFL